MAATIDFNYHQVHHWLNRTFGLATHCENKNCKCPEAKRFEYALKKGFSYEKNKDNFIMLCISCHRKYDYTPEAHEAIVNSRKRKPIIQLSKENVKINEYASICEAAEKTSVNKGNIKSTLRNKRPSAGGYFWTYKN
jgi:hypothetical protein